MPKIDRDRLAKILALTTSDTDGEALAAIRRANYILKEAGLDWASVLAPQHVVNIRVASNNPPPGAFGMNPEDFKPDEDWIAPHLKDRVIIETMFRAIYSQPRTGNDEFWEWLDSVDHHFRTYDQLTANQYQALRRCYLRACRTTVNPPLKMPER